MRRWSLGIALLVCVDACGGPVLFIPGPALRGRVVDEPPADWSFVTDEYVYRLDPREP